jgi:hypothetical protein
VYIQASTWITGSAGHRLPTGAAVIMNVVGSLIGAPEPGTFVLVGLVLVVYTKGVVRPSTARPSLFGSD